MGPKEDKCLMQLSVEKRKIIRLGMQNKKRALALNNHIVQNTKQKKNLEIVIDKDLKASVQWLTVIIKMVPLIQGGNKNMADEAISALHKGFMNEDTFGIL